jgi:hypothetical protein
MDEYVNRTGVPWRHYYGPEGPRSPPVLFMWPAELVGNVHRMRSAQGYWLCDGKSPVCRSKDPVTLELEVVATQPRVFIIENFLSDYEADHLRLAANPTLHQSTVGNK